MTGTVTALVVTFNRRSLLWRCLLALDAQIRRPDRILVVDNASTDDTVEWLESKGWAQRADTELLRLPENTGGAGGFAAGISHAADRGADWIWIMDDDALPHADALQALLDMHPEPVNLYGSVAVCGSRLAWPMQPPGAHWRQTIYETSGLPKLFDVQFIPFLGLLVGRDMVERIGTPDAAFFIAADDVDYCLRARRAGARVLLVGASRIEHPPSERYSIWLPWRPFFSLRLAPWKRYYDVRNRLFVARNHYGWALYYSTIPGSCLRLLVTLINEKERLRQIQAFAAGMIDGLIGRKGRRHERWGLRA